MIITRLCLVATIGLSLLCGEQTAAQDTFFENVTEAAGLGGGEFVAWADYNNSPVIVHDIIVDEELRLMRNIECLRLFTGLHLKRTTG